MPKNFNQLNKEYEKRVESDRDEREQEEYLSELEEGQTLEERTIEELKRRQNLGDSVISMRET